MTLGVDLGLERDKLRSRCLSEIKSFSLCFRIILSNSEMLQYWQLSKFLDWSWRNSLPFSVKLWFLVKERGAIGASLKIFSKCWLEIELKGSSLLRRACRTSWFLRTGDFCMFFVKIFTSNMNHLQYCTDHSRLLYAFWLLLFKICHMGV